jgi:outer membrane receptor for ferrienterochelin and colicins
VYGRGELERNGDTSLGEVLKHLPGVTMSGAPGSAGSVQMRGLGNGYTQLRISGNNLLPRRYEAARVVETAELVQALTTQVRTYASLGVRLELKI